MKKAAIISDTTACVPQEQAAEYGIQLVPMAIVFGDKTYRDGIDMTAKEFYSLLKQAVELPTTSHPSPDAFLEAYREASRTAESVLCITLSSNFSASLNSARLAMDMAKETLPGLYIEVLDCGTAAAAQGMVVLAAARAAASGKSLAEVIETARRVMSDVILFAMLDTLNYLVKGGRVPRIAGLVGSLLKIKPIFTLKDGKAHFIMNSRSTSNAIDSILELMETKKMKGPLHTAVMHADAPDKAAELRNRIASRFDCAELFITEFTPVMGVHTGPGLVGAAFYNGD